MHKFKGNTVLIVVTIVLAIIVVVAIGFAAYFWGKSQSPAATTATTSPTLTKTSPTVSPSHEPKVSPKEVVENFMNTTLGTLPEASVNYDLARTYMTEDFKAQHSGEGWVPLMYGIQDGPTSVKFISENISGEQAIVRCDPSWEEMSLGWAFTLKKVNNQWYINGFSNTAQ